MKNLSAKSMAKHSRLARQLMRYHFPNKSISIKPLTGGITNYVFHVAAGNAEFVVRMSDEAEKFHTFQKEQWAVAQARTRGVPVPEILEVGNEIIPVPYMILKKIRGEEATHHNNRHEVIREMGRYAAIIHTIPTRDYGNVFDWSPNMLSKNNSWEGYLHSELEIESRISILKRNKMIPEKLQSRINGELAKIKKWSEKPCLHHGDLRLKNMLVDKEGKISAIIDWENCVSMVSPSWDISIALHDLSIDAQWRFLDGYGLTSKKLLQLAPAIKVFNLLNYAPAIERIIKAKDKEKLDHYRLRLNGVLDLFSL
jgi:hygromycin-B 4-O-kinase